MTMSRVLGKAISRVLIGVLLFAQFAVASYACPSLKDIGAVSGEPAIAAPAAGADAAATQSAAVPPGCHQLDADAANLCVEHCRQSQRSADTAAAPQVSPGLPTLLYALPIEPRQLLAAARAFPASDVGLAADPEPPHAILHCVFRI